MSSAASASARLQRVMHPATGLGELIREHPEAWEQVSQELLTLMETRRAEVLQAHMVKLRAEADQWHAQLRRSGQAPYVVEAAFPALLRVRLSFLALEKYFLAVASGQTQGVVRLSLFNGKLLQRLLFRRGLERKAVSLRWFQVVWPLISQRRVVMPLLQPKGIYCFYSDRLVAELAKLIDGRPCLELAAGDGTLARLLKDASVAVTATDDQSWKQHVRYPAWVEPLEARAALQKYQPEVVLCSWPPPGNPFEKQVFRTNSVQLYVVIGSRHAFATGDWAAYAQQQSFAWSVDLPLSGAVLPPELDSAVVVFRRLERLRAPVPGAPAAPG